MNNEKNTGDEIIIDGFGFSRESVSAMTLDQFKSQYRDQRPYGTEVDNWDKWMTKTYGMIVPAKSGKPAKSAEAEK